MESSYELSIPDTTTPIKLENNGENILCSSPSMLSGGAMASMISTGGTPIASLKTPTKALISQSTANKHVMALSPTRLYVKQDINEYTAAGVSAALPIAPAVQAAPVTLTSASNSALYQPSDPNNKLQYVTIVSSQADNVSSAPRQVMTQMRPQPALTPMTNMDQMQLANYHMQQQPPQHNVNRQIASNNASQRVLLPAGSSQTLRISGSQSLAQIKSQLPPGTTILSSSDSSGQMLAFLPTSHTVIHKAPSVKQLYAGGNQSMLRAQDYNTSAAEAAPLTNGTHTAPVVNNSSSDANKQKKPCNCTKSQCLKLYCDCFANGEFCSNCNCQNCFNNLDHEEERQKAVKQCLERNPLAFHPKIGKSAKADARRHQKGCNCKRSGCLKNYCECYEAKIPCGSMCKCVGCKNCEGHDTKGLMHLADAADLRHSQLSHTSHNQNSYIPETPSPQPYLKKPVIEAVIDCLIAQCREAETAKCKDSTTEKVILEEFGRCLSELIKASSQSRK